jgi:beta-lactamase regulating signal transducer with metallopeptidase domain
VIFAARAIMVSLAFLALVYTFLSLALSLAWICLGSKVGRYLSANALFVLRVTPFAASAVVSIFLILPSFVELETHSMDEDLGTFVLALSALLFFGAGFIRVVSAELRTRRIVDACVEDAHEFEHDIRTPAVVAPKSISPLMMVGIRIPKIVISESTPDILSDAELRVAVRHEVAHLEARDNLKKAIFNSLPFPGMKGMLETWQEAAELAADDAAVSTRTEALDLAAALIKLARHFPGQAIPDFATGFVGGGPSTAKRVERLLAWKKSTAVASRRWPYALIPALAASLVLAAKLEPALALMHSVTERLVP